MSELKIQKRLTTLGLVSLLSTPFMGPVGLLGASVAFSGKLLRLCLNEEANRNYKNERKTLRETRKANKRENFYSRENSYLPESPKTAIARRTPYSVKKLLDRENQRESYVEGLREGSKVVNDYLDRLSGEQISRINQIEIYPEQETVFGRKKLEIKIK